MFFLKVLFSESLQCVETSQLTCKEISPHWFLYEMFFLQVLLASVFKECRFAFIISFIFSEIVNKALV